MPKRSHLGWRTHLFRCLHFALSFVGIWLQPIVIIKPGIRIYDGRIVADVATKIERSDTAMIPSNVARTSGQVNAGAVSGCDTRQCRKHPCTGRGFLDDKH